MTDPDEVKLLPCEEVLKLEWRDGAPPRPWDKEWFIAMTTYGDRVVLKALPEEFAYDFKTADETYIMRDKITKWMQFPDSEFIAPAATRPPVVTDEVVAVAKAAFTAGGISHIAGDNPVEAWRDFEKCIPHLIASMPAVVSGGQE